MNQSETKRNNHAEQSSNLIQQLLTTHLHTFTTTLLPSVCSTSTCDWTRIRHLPPSLVKPILQASPVVYQYHTWIRGVVYDLSKHIHVKSTLLLQSVAYILHTTLQPLITIYLSLKPSRFHSRQHFVDLATVLTIGRAWIQWLEMEGDKLARAGDSRDNGAAAASSFPPSHTVSNLIDSINILLVRLTFAVFILHPSHISLGDLVQLVKTLLKEGEGKGEEKQQMQNSSSTSSSVNNRLDLTFISTKFHALWNCEVMKPQLAESEADSQDAPSSSSFSILSTYFSLPTLAPSVNPSTPTSSASTSTPSPPSAPVQISVTQDLRLDSASDFILFTPSMNGTDSTTATAPQSNYYHNLLPPSELLRIIQLRHEFRVDDFPELTKEEERVVAEMRDL